jgi:biotin transport system substrate-specific component
MNRQKAMIFAALFAALTAAVSFFKIPLPFTPVPITLQTLMVLLSGAMLGSSYGALAMIIYLLLGLIGLPVFSGGSSGLGAILGPTGGFLLSFPVAAFVVGKLSSTKKITGLLLAMLIGTLIIYMFGAIQGTLVTHLGLTAIFVGWILPFIIGDAIKLLLAAWIARSVDINKYLRSPQ